MRKKIVKKNTAFTLVEVLTTSAILLFVLMAICATYIMISQFVRDTSSQALLQSRNRLAMEAMVRNIRLASDISCPPAGTSITLTYDPAKMGSTGSTWTTRYRLSGSQIFYTPNLGTSSEIVVLSNVKLGTKKLFQYDPGTKMAVINSRIENTTLTTVQDSNLTTAVKVRNAE